MGMSALFEDVVLTNHSVVARVDGDDDDGRAVYVGGGAVMVVGGGSHASVVFVRVEVSGSRVSLTDWTPDGADVTYGGGGVMVVIGSRVVDTWDTAITMTNCTIRDNVVYAGEKGGRRGGASPGCQIVIFCSLRMHWGLRRHCVLTMWVHVICGAANTSKADVGSGGGALLHVAGSTIGAASVVIVGSVIEDNWSGRYFVVVLV